MKTKLLAAILNICLEADPECKIDMIARGGIKKLYLSGDFSKLYGKSFRDCTNNVELITESNIIICL